MSVVQLAAGIFLIREDPIRNIELANISRARRGQSG